jgi:hypothetical protein
VEYKSYRNIKKKARKLTTRDISIFEDFANRIAQQDMGAQNPQDMEQGTADQTQQNPEQDNPNLDPNQLTQGQSIYDNAGQEYTVLNPTEDGSGNVNVMPSDQKSQQVPSGVKQLTQDDLASSYTLQPMASRVAQEEPYELNWGDFTDIVNDMNVAIGKQDMKSLLEQAQDLIELIMMNIQMPSDTDISQAFAKSSCTKVHPGFRKAQWNDIPSTSKGKSGPESLTIGEGGFSKCMGRLKELVKGKYPTVDILLTLGEEFDKETVNKVLNEARAQGII